MDLRLLDPSLIITKNGNIPVELKAAECIDIRWWWAIASPLISNPLLNLLMHAIVAATQGVAALVITGTTSRIS